MVMVVLDVHMQQRQDKFVTGLCVEFTELLPSSWFWNGDASRRCFFAIRKKNNREEQNPLQWAC